MTYNSSNLTINKYQEHQVQQNKDPLYRFLRKRMRASVLLIYLVLTIMDHFLKKDVLLEDQEVYIFNNLILFSKLNLAK